ncbi:MAG: nitroreductase [Sphingobacteriales bacterium]|nr:nitroreductase [Sphingobacteriales bacterium]
MGNSFSVISSIIKQRRSTKPANFNGKVIPDNEIEQLLELADWAPTHANTEPWRFIVYSGSAAVKQFCQVHAELYKANVLPENFLQANYDKILQNGDKASHIIVTIMQRGNLPKMPALEEVAAVAAATQNILLGATALGIASFWSTSGMTHHAAMKQYFQLREQDVIMGILFLGYTDVVSIGKRIVPLSTKVKWEK